LSWTLAFRSCLADRRGAVAIEFAAIALPFILLLAGTMEISRYTWTRVALQDVASAGARCLGLQLPPCFAAGSMDHDATVAHVREQAKGWGVTIAEDTVTPEPDVECETLDDFAKVRIGHQFTSVLVALPDIRIEVEACFPAPPP
jgi:Flp pilus assembly protein TadG